MMAPESGVLSAGETLVVDSVRDAKMLAVCGGADDTQRIGLKCVIMPSESAAYGQPGQQL